MWNLSESTPVLDSREVAQMIGKTHGHLLRDIDSYRAILSESIFGLSDFFRESAYKDSTGRVLPCYQVTKKGCELIAHKLTGKKGILFTAAYINRFYEMEEILKDFIPGQVMYYNGQPILPEEDFLRLLSPEKRQKRWLYHHAYFRPAWDFNGMGLDLKAEFEQKYRRHYDGETLMYMYRSGVEIALRLYGVEPELCKEIMALVDPQKGIKCAKSKQTYLTDRTRGEINVTVGNTALNIRL